MKIELVYCSSDDRHLDDGVIRKWLVVHDDADISEILNPFYAQGLAKWQDDKLGGQVISNYQNSGRLESGTSYSILSKNIPMTILALKNINSTDISVNQNTR